MSGHTPGPWELQLRERKRPHGEASTVEGSLRRSGAMPVEIVARVDFGYGRAVDEANARLIAAAPDLLLLVEELAKGPALHACDTRGERNDARNQWLLGLREKAKAAIAKATGGKP